MRDLAEARVESDGERLLGRLLDAAHTVAPEDLAALVAERAADVGATDVALYLQDYDQRTLVPITSVGMPEREAEAIEGSMPGRAFTGSDLVEWPAPVGTRLWYPMVNGTDRVGVLGLTLPEVGDYERQLGGRLAALVAHLIATKGSYTDLFFQTRRRQAMSLAAEMQWQLLPPLTISVPGVAIAGALQPAYDVGGDAFDYALNGRTAHLGIFDAIGHSTRAAVMASVVVGAYRHARRQGVNLAETYGLIDAAVTHQFGDEDFATAQMVELDLDTGRLAWVNAGHPQPLLVRHRKLIRSLSSDTTLPAGVGGATPTVAMESLEPGDRVLFYTDGAVEQRLVSGEMFGEHRLVEHLLREEAAGRSVSETARRLSQALAAQWGGPASDDATLVLLEWSGPDQALVMPG